MVVEVQPGVASLNSSLPLCFAAVGGLLYSAACWWLLTSHLEAAIGGLLYSVACWWLLTSRLEGGEGVQ